MKLTRDDSVKLATINHNWTSSESAGVTMRLFTKRPNQPTKNQTNLANVVESTNESSKLRTMQWSITGSSCIYLDPTAPKEP